MKPISIELFNFRQFYGRSPRIQLASEPRNTTVIYGSNGAGKTTLMNAFTWVLYEQFSLAFAAADRLVNKRAIAEADIGKAVVCWVELVFDRDNKRYQVKRLCRAYKNETEVELGKSQVFMQVAAEDGRWSPPPQPAEAIVNRILPASLHQYFFFDGEQIEKIVRADKKEEIADATKELLGVTVLDRAIRHLGDARKSLENHLKGIGNPETKNLVKQKQELETERDRLLQRQTEIEGDRQHLANLKKTLNSRLLELGGAAQLQQLRRELEDREAEVSSKLQQTQRDLSRTISTKGYSVFLPTVTAKFRDSVEGWRQNGELPTGIKRQFVRQLLDRQTCICGTQLQPETPPHQQVRSWMEKAGAEDVEETAIRISAKLDRMENIEAEFWQDLDRLQLELNQSRGELSRLETELDEVKDKLRRYPDEDIQQLQKRLDDIETKTSDRDRETGSNQQQIEHIQSEIDTVSKELDKQILNEQKQILAQRRIAATREAVDRLIEVRSRLDDQFRKSLEARVQEIFDRISFAPYIPKLSENYELTLVENTSGREQMVAASTGENQILSLSFIGAIVDCVRQWSRKNTLMGPDSSTFPIVMDSPFGSLDATYRRQVAQSIPKLANQLIVLVTKTQWRGEVATEMETFIGKEYVLSYYSSKPDCQEETIEVKGRSYPLVRRSPNEFEYTEIIPVEE